MKQSCTLFSKAFLAPKVFVVMSVSSIYKQIRLNTHSWKPPAKDSKMLKFGQLLATYPNREKAKHGEEILYQVEVLSALDLAI